MSNESVFAEQAVNEARERLRAPGLSEAELEQCKTELAAAEARLKALTSGTS